MAAELQFEHKPKLVLALQDSLLMIARSSRHIIRNRDQLLGTFFQPIMFLVLFVYVFGGAIHTSTGSYINFLLAGIIVQTAAFGSTTTALGVTTDLQKGIMDRFRSLPMFNLAVLTGHVVSDLFRTMISSTVMILVGLAIGFRPHASFTDWLLITGILLLFTLAFSWLSAIMGLIAKSVEGVQWLGFVLVFPLTFASSAFVPTAGMAKGLKIFAENQPITQVVNAVRSLMNGLPVGNTVWLSVVWCLGILAVGIPLSSYMFRKKTTS
ncbi:MAG TPA: ABC transporter permease [Candidatus Saccharimonadales bacterium]|nr:ABC transporter permease [Candidatus Saccharimonadales bacterium]